MSVQLTNQDRHLLKGEEGPGVALAMRILVRTAEAMGATHLLDIVSAHIDGCLYHGKAGLDFAEALVEGGASVRIPTTLNVTSLDLLHPELVNLEASTEAAARRLVAAYSALGARPTWTCAPYQLPQRPGQGDQIAWAESNAIVFANSVLGARTERYGDFLDICAAVTGRAPAVGLHLDESRRATFALSVEAHSELFDQDWPFPLLGHVLGERAGGEVGAIIGLPPHTGEDRLKALGAAAASSGSVAMFHAVGLTPEAPDLDTATHGTSVDIHGITRDDLTAARAALTTSSGGTIDAVSLGTPHYSREEIETLAHRLQGLRCSIPTFVNTGRDVLSSLSERAKRTLDSSGVSIVTDTCTYITPILDETIRTVMTDSAKWAYYAPANLGVEVVFASLDECVAAATGTIS